MRLRDPVARGRVGEDQAAVADRRDHQPVGLGELGAERRADRPAEAAGRAQREIAAGAFEPAVLGPHVVLVEDERVVALHLSQAAADPSRRDRVLAAGGVRFGRPGGTLLRDLRGEARAPLGQADVVGREAACERGIERRKVRTGSAGIARSFG